MNKLKIMELLPRDGFQSVDEFIDTKYKLEIIDRLVDCGIKDIQVTSFISPKAIAQMSDSNEVAKYCLEKYGDINLFALTPNLKGIENGYNVGLRNLSYVISVSESHNMANVRKTVTESLEELKSAIDKYKDVQFNLDVATAFGCPFEGEISLEQVSSLVNKAYDIGIRVFDICDTIGVAYPTQVQKYMRDLIQKYPDAEFGIHIHDTRNMGMINTYMAIKEGVKRVFSVCSGLGGCPFAPGASGNTATEDLVNMLQKCGYDIDIDSKKLVEIAKYIKSTIPSGNYSSHHINISNRF